jgi:hypothetical protein
MARRARRRRDRSCPADRRRLGETSPVGRTAGQRKTRRVTVNRAPVLTLWAAVVAERLGFDRREALTLGRAVAGLNAYSKGRALGLFHPRPAAVKRRRRGAGRRIEVALLHRAVPALRTPDGVRALSKGIPIAPESVERYLEAKFGAALPATRAALAALARSLPPGALAGRAYSLYEAFRPGVPAGRRGWGARGRLDLDRIRALARGAGRPQASRPAPGGSAA